VKGIEVDVTDQERGKGWGFALRNTFRTGPVSLLRGKSGLRFAPAGQWGAQENEQPKPKGDLQPRKLADKQRCSFAGQDQPDQSISRREAKVVSSSASSMAPA